MMMNLFTLFDPTMFNMPMNIIINSYLLLMMIKTQYNNQFMNNIKYKLITMNMKFNYKNTKSINSIMMIMMTMLMLNNLINITPMIISQTSNLMFNLNLTLIMWSINLIMLMKNNNLLFMNMSPNNSPMIILFIINMIELNSFMFQIMSLTMRLTINMMLGHMIMHLMNNFIMIKMYMIIELFVILIQTYIFTILNFLNFNNNI